ncbi:MAG: transposase [Acetobacteraceae bacterium]|nr:transposase [Acetobacteraceae bacterium]
MPLRRFRKTPKTLPPDILPHDFIQRHDLIQRLYLGPLKGLTPAHAWAPLTDAEWGFLGPLLPGTAQGGPGRPLPDPRARLDAIFRAVTLKRPWEKGGGRGTWTQLPESFGKHATVARCFRRWAHLGLWTTLLGLVADRDGRPPHPLLLGLRWRICCAFRRAYRLLGLAGIMLARRLGLYSALPAPSTWLPDPDLSATYIGVINRAVQRIGAAGAMGADGTWRPSWRPPKAAWRLFRSMLRIVGGRRRIRRVWEPA